LTMISLESRDSSFRFIHQPKIARTLSINQTFRQGCNAKSVSQKHLPTSSREMRTHLGFILRLPPVSVTLTNRLLYWMRCLEIEVVSQIARIEKSLPARS
jgi:hypothetical protein